MNKKEAEDNRYVWIKSGCRKVLLDSRWNEIVTEIGAVDEIVDYNDFQIIRRDEKFGCVKDGELIVPIKYDIITPSLHHKILIIQNRIDESDLLDNYIHVIGNTGIETIPTGKDVFCDDSKESPIIRVDDICAFYLYSSDMLSQFEYDEIISEPGFVITKITTDDGKIKQKIFSTSFGYAIASEFIDYYIIDEEQVFVKDVYGSWYLLRLEEKWDELYGNVKSFEKIFDTPFYEFNINKNGTIILEKEDMYYVYFPHSRCLSDSYERIVCCCNDIENGNPFAVGYKNGRLAVVSSLHATECVYDFISTPISNYVLAISSCGGYDGKLKAVCEIINLANVYKEEGYIFITDELSWKDYQQLYKDNKLTFEKYSKYEGGGTKSIRVPFLNDKIIQLSNQDGKKEIMVKTFIEKGLGIDIFSASKIGWGIMSEQIEERNKEYYSDDIPIDDPSDAFDCYSDAYWNID